MKQFFLFAATALALTLGSCSSPMSKPYSDATLGEDMKAITEAGKLDSTQRQLLAMYLVRAKLTDEPLTGSTYQQILDKATALKTKQEKEEAETKALAAKAAAEAEAQMKQLRDVATVAVFNKGFHGKDYDSGQFQEYVTFDVAIENKSAKDIRAITGTVVFNDLFDKTIKKISLTNDSGIKSGKTLKYGSGMDYNQYIDSDVLFRSKGFDKMKIVWMPEKVLFADGSTMSAEQVEAQ